MNLICCLNVSQSASLGALYVDYILLDELKICVITLVDWIIELIGTY